MNRSGRLTKKVILDTDIGTDVDDALALGVLLGSPEVELVGVTCVYGDVRLRVRMVRKLLRLAGGRRCRLCRTGAAIAGGAAGLLAGA